MSKRIFSIQTLSVYVSTTLVLVLLGMMGLLLVTSKSLSEHVRKNVTVTVIMDNERSGSDAASLCKQLERRNYTAAARHITKEEILEEQKAELGTDPVIFLGYNPYNDAIELSMNPAYANSDSLAAIEKRLLATRGVKEVYYNRDLMDAINNNINKIGAILLVLMALLTIISWSLIGNMVRLSIYSKRFLLHTMKLVGAGWGFIRRPFLIHNLRVGLISAIFANTILCGAIYAVAQKEPAILTILPTEGLIAVGTGIILFGIIITVLCAYRSVNRFLRMRSNDLYFI